MNFRKTLIFEEREKRQREKNERKKDRKKKRNKGRKRKEERERERKKGSFKIIQMMLKNFISIPRTTNVGHRIA